MKFYRKCPDCQEIVPIYLPESEFDLFGYWDCPECGYTMEKEAWDRLPDERKP